MLGETAKSKYQWRKPPEEDKIIMGPPPPIILLLLKLTNYMYTSRAVYMPL